MAGRRHRLAQRRKSLGFTQEGLAERLGVDSSTVRRWESGDTENGPQPWLRPKLAQYLQVSIEQLEELLSDATAADETSSPLNLGKRQQAAVTLADARRYSDGPVADYFRRQLDDCEAADGLAGPTAALPAVLGVLGAIYQYADEVTPAVRRELLSVGARGAEFAGWLYRDIHQVQQAAFWYGRATEWAQEAGDLPMQGYVLLRKSQMAYDDRDAVRVLTLAQAAQYGPWQLANHVRAEVTQQEARGLAMLGERIDTVQRKLDEARRLLANSDQASADQESTLTLRDASCYIEAGRPRQAAVLYAQILATDHLSPRDRGYFLARLASSLALAGEPDEAAEQGLAAAQVASAKTSQRTRRELMRTLETLKLWRNRPGPRALREALATSPSLVTNRSLPSLQPFE